MAGFLFKLETKDGLPAEPPTLSSAVPNWRAGDTIPLGRRTLRVVDVRDEDADQPPVLVVVEAVYDSHPTAKKVLRAAGVFARQGVRLTRG